MEANLSATHSNVCSVIDTFPYVIVAALSACSAVVSALCCTFVIGLIFVLKKHYFFIQRIILYHCLAALFRSLSVVLRLHRLEYPAESRAQDILCVISGFTGQLTLWFIIMDYLMITFALLMTAVFHKNVSRLEGLYVVVIFIFPLTFNWIPFIDNSYGRAGPWCWIRSLNYDDCSEHHLGAILGIVLWNVPFFSLLLVIISIYLFTIAYVARKRYCKSEKNTYDSEMDRLKKHLNKEVWPILFFPFGAVFLNIFIFINTFYTLVGADPSYPIWVLHGIFGELQGGYIALVYVLDRDTLKRLTYSNVKARVTRRDTVREYPMEGGGAALSDTAEHCLSAIHYRQYGDNNSELS